MQVAGEKPVRAGEYRELIKETAVDWSHACHSGDPGRPFVTGALARMDGSGSLPGWPAGIHANNPAQGLEIAWALERALQLIAEVRRLPADVPLLVPVEPQSGWGVALLEAPRGVLVHSYLLDEFGVVRRADIITPTAVNQLAMEAQLRADLALLPPARHPGPVAERIIRAFDPCVSCAVHVIESGV